MGGQPGNLNALKHGGRTQRHGLVLLGIGDAYPDIAHDVRRWARRREAIAAEGNGGVLTDEAREAVNLAARWEATARVHHRLAGQANGDPEKGLYHLTAAAKATEKRQAVIEAAKRYRLQGVWADKWQAAHLPQRLRRRGVRAHGVDFTGHYLRTMAAETMVAFREHKIELYSSGDGAELVRDLRNLRLVENSYGVRLESPRGPSGHGDAATELALALLGARELRGVVRTKRNMAYLPQFT